MSTLMETDKSDVLTNESSDVELYNNEEGGEPNIIIGGDGGEIIFGTDGDDEIYGGDGDDEIYSGGGDNYIYGGDGDDKIYGGDGDDWIDGGAGNDYMEGGAGDDVYMFFANDGQDVINNAGGGNDVLILADANPIDLWFERNNDDLTIKIVGTANQVTVSSWFTDGDYKIDHITTLQYQNSNSSIFSLVEDQVEQMVQALAAFGAPAGADGNWSDEQREALPALLQGYWQRSESLLPI